MDIRKIGSKDDEVTIAWTDQPIEKSKTEVQHEMKSTDTPSPAFRQAMADIVAPVVRILELPRKYGEGITFRSLSISERSGGRKAYVVSVMKPIDATNGPFNISTPQIVEPSEETEGAGAVGVPDDLRAAIDALARLGASFAGGLERENVDLFGPEAEETEPAVAVV